MPIRPFWKRSKLSPLLFEASGSGARLARRCDVFGFQTVSLETTPHRERDVRKRDDLVLRRQPGDTLLAGHLKCRSLPVSGQK